MQQDTTHLDKLEEQFCTIPLSSRQLEVIYLAALLKIVFFPCDFVHKRVDVLDGKLLS